MVRCSFSQKSSGWSYNRIQLQGSIWCCVYVFKKTFGWSYNRIQLHSSIWWSVYIHKKYQDGVTIEDTTNFQCPESMLLYIRKLSLYIGAWDPGTTNFQCPESMLLYIRKLSLYRSMGSGHHKFFNSYLPV